MNLATIGIIAGSLERACLAWETEGNFDPLSRWLSRQVTTDGCPKLLAIEDWGPSIHRLHASQGRRPGWPEAERTRVEGWFARLIHFSRPDGSTMFGPRGKDRDRTAWLKEGVAIASDPSLASVVDRWFPSAAILKGQPSPPPLPARSETDQVLAMLRPDWTAEGDWVAIDQRGPASPCRVEVAGDGRPWISGDWSTAGTAGTARPTSWTTGAYADAQEWSFRAGSTKIMRTVVLLRYRKVALIAQQEEGPPASAFRLPLAAGTTTAAVAEQRSLTLIRGRAKARLIPLGLPTLPYETDKGSLSIEGDEAVLSGPGVGRRRWLPMLLSWGKPPSQWRTCTVTEKSETCRPEVAFGARVAWGSGDDGLLIYRSLGPPALRVVLGYQTRARFLIGRFTPEGNVVPLLTLV